MSDAVPREETHRDTVPPLRHQQELALLLLFYLSRYMVSVRIQVPEYDAATGAFVDHCFVNRVQLIEGDDGKVAEIPFSLLFEFAQQELRKGRKPVISSLSMMNEDVVDKIHMDGSVTRVSEPTTVRIAELGFVCDGNLEGKHLNAVIRRACGDVDASFDTAWRAARPSTMALANDPSYAGPSPIKAHADIISMMHVYDNNEICVLPAVRIVRSLAEGQELFLSYDEGHAKTIDFPE